MISGEQGLTPALFWRHQDQFLRTPEGDLPNLISQLIQPSSSPPSSDRDHPIDHSSPTATPTVHDGRKGKGRMIRISPTNSLHICPSPLDSSVPSNEILDRFDKVIMISASPSQSQLRLETRASTAKDDFTEMASPLDEEKKKTDEGGEMQRMEKDTKIEEEGMNDQMEKKEKQKILWVNYDPSKAGYRNFDQELRRVQIFLSSSPPPPWSSDSTLVKGDIDTSTAADNAVTADASPCAANRRTNPKTKEPLVLVACSSSSLSSSTKSNSKSQCRSQSNCMKDLRDMCLGITLVTACLLYDDHGKRLSVPLIFHTFPIIIIILIYCCLR